MPENVSNKARFRSACLNSDWPTAATTLIAWTCARGSNARNLGEVARSLDGTDQIVAIDDLQRVLYASAPAGDLAAKLTSAFRDGPRIRNEIADRKKSALPPLYASRTGSGTP